MKRILWDVDTQVDFMEPSGKLYVPDAKEIAPALEQLVDAARSAGVVHVASADDHELTDPEISDSPDLRNTYPPHCLRGTRGAERILETKQRDPLPLSRPRRRPPGRPAGALRRGTSARASCARRRHRACARRRSRREPSRRSPQGRPPIYPFLSFPASAHLTTLSSSE